MQEKINLKQVIVVRRDLNMRKGKMCSQAAHASMAAILTKDSNSSSGFLKKVFLWLGDFIFGIDNSTKLVDTVEVRQWLAGKFTKICVSVDSEKELLDIYKSAKAEKLLCSLIQDAGLTEFGGVPTYTAVAIGPAKPEKIDKITGHLKLL